MRIKSHRHIHSWKSIVLILNHIKDWRVFFFQAEDGIRDRSPSRGLGDVYKRQFLDGVSVGKTNITAIVQCGRQ